MPTRSVGYALASASGVLLAVSFPKFGHPAFGWIALAPLLVALAGVPLRRAFLQGLLTGVVYFTGTLYWITRVMATYGDIQFWVAILINAALVAYLSLFPAIFALVMRRIAITHGPPALMAAPFVGFWIRTLKPYLPEQGWYYGEDMLTDRSEKFLASEIIREKLFRLTGDELPYTSTVVIDEFKEEGNLRRISASIVVERDSHKGIVIGNGGERLKRIGSEARQELETLMDAKVFLELWVKVRSGWADDEAHLRSYGYE